MIAPNKSFVGLILCLISGGLIWPCQAMDLNQQLGLFLQALGEDNETQALELGRTIYETLGKRYNTNGGFLAYQSKVKLAEHLTAQMISHLRQATRAQMSTVMDEVFEEGAKQKPLPLAPAKRFYDTSIQNFNKPIAIGAIDPQHKHFLAQYYNLYLRYLVNQVARTGRAIALVEPSFKSTYDYVLVLPLLHTSREQAINIGILPTWMNKAEHLQQLTDSCLFQFSMPYQAMEMARLAVAKTGEGFSEIDFYRNAANRCGTEYVHTAVDCLKRAYHAEEPSEVDDRVSILFNLIQYWLNNENYDLAAGEAHQLREQFPDHPLCGKAIYLYYYSLSRASKLRDILSTIDKDLEDARYTKYRDSLLFIKWHALRNTRNEEARLLAVEHELLQRCADNPIIAPVMFSRATDRLARQDYQGAVEILTELLEKFPQTNAAVQAQRMLPKLQKIKN